MSNILGMTNVAIEHLESLIALNTKLNVMDNSYLYELLNQLKLSHESVLTDSVLNDWKDISKQMENQS